MRAQRTTATNAVGKLVQRAFAARRVALAARAAQTALGHRGAAVDRLTVFAKCCPVRSGNCNCIKRPVLYSEDCCALDSAKGAKGQRTKKAAAG